MHRSTLAAALLATLTVAMLAESPALADSKSVRDPRGDAPAHFDLTTVRATNSGSAITVRAHIRDLQGHATQIFWVTLRPAGGDSYYALSTVRRKSGRTTARIETIDSSGNFTEVPCHISSKWRPARDVIAVAFPRDCIPQQGSVRFNFYIGAGDGSAGDPTDWTKSVRVAQD